MMINKHLLLFLLLFSFTIMTGCVPKTYKAHPQLETLSKTIHNPGMVPPDIKIYEISAGGVPELEDEWSETGKQNVIKALMEDINNKVDSLSQVELDTEMEDEVEDVLALYRAVSMSILQHTYQGPYVFPEKQKNFDYSVGSIKNILETFGTDSLLLVSGMDQISTGGRKILIAVASIVGVGGVHPGLTMINVALVDASGQILWYDIKADIGSYDLRDANSAAKMVKNVLSDFPDIGK